MNVQLLALRGAVASLEKEDQDKFHRAKGAIAEFANAQFEKEGLDADLKVGLISMVALEALEELQ